MQSRKTNNVAVATAALASGANNKNNKRVNKKKNNKGKKLSAAERQRQLVDLARNSGAIVAEPKATEAAKAAKAKAKATEAAKDAKEKAVLRKVGVGVFAVVWWCVGG